MAQFSPWKIGLGLGLIGGAAIIAIACSDDPHRRTSREQALGGGGACEAEPGALPAPDCDNSEKACEPREGCQIDEAKCGSKSTCLPIGDNKGKDVLDFRMRRLNIAAPPALAARFIQNTVVDLNLTLAEPVCAEKGKGLFTWLLRVDKKNNTLITGGSPPARDPFGEGFCFASFDLNGTMVAPIETKIEIETVGDNQRFKSLDRKNVNIPIFITEQASSAIILPISDVLIEGVTISEEGNCIGKLNTAALDPSCNDDRTLCSKWTTAGSLGGYITLEEADKVTIKDLGNKSLCSFLSSSEPLTCPRDGAGQIIYKGDFCSKDKTPGSCQDSIWLAATFAASAAKIFDGTGKVEGCSGVSTADAGTEDAATDAATDAPADAPDDG